MTNEDKKRNKEEKTNDEEKIDEREKTVEKEKTDEKQKTYEAEKAYGEENTNKEKPNENEKTNKEAWTNEVKQRKMRRQTKKKNKRKKKINEEGNTNEMNINREEKSNEEKRNEDEKTEKTAEKKTTEEQAFNIKTCLLLTFSFDDAFIEKEDAEDAEEHPKINHYVETFIKMVKKLQSSTNTTTAFKVFSENIFILALDGDVKFEPEALLSLMRRLKNLRKLEQPVVEYIRWEQVKTDGCVLYFLKGMKIEYTAESDAYTFVPEGFYKFYNQRRRWTPSTIANIVDLLISWREITKENNNISVLSTSLQFAAILSCIYGIVMLIGLIGVVRDAVDIGFCSIATIFILFQAGVFIISAILHPKEFLCIIPGFIYFFAIPSMSMLMFLYAIGNLHDVSWGTRDTKSEAKSFIGKSQEEIEQEKGHFCSFGKFCTCMFCSTNNYTKSDYILSILNKWKYHEDDLDGNQGNTETGYRVDIEDLEFAESHREQDPEEISFVEVNGYADRESVEIDEQENKWWIQTIKSHLKPFHHVHRDPAKKRKFYKRKKLLNKKYLICAIKYACLFTC
ncbi:CHS1 [Mytilus edulis]|uniref:CHS1 n=1 Tax=Mytilus edulis TaxID=6550 RepID=A0A8S3TCE6_MYTED|nr:CHS1 [Mytilus edulis]